MTVVDKLIPGARCEHDGLGPRSAGAATRSSDSLPPARRPRDDDVAATSLAIARLRWYAAIIVALADEEIARLRRTLVDLAGGPVSSHEIAGAHAAIDQWQASVARLRGHAEGWTGWPGV